MWSNTNYFTSLGDQVPQVVSTKDVEGAFHFSRKNMLSKYFTPNVEPEVITIFIQPGMRTDELVVLADAYKTRPDGGAYKNVKRMVETAKSSLVLPYVYSDSISTDEKTIIGSVIADVLSRKDTDAQLILASDDSTVTSWITARTGVSPISLKTLTDLSLSNEWGVLRNGVADLIIVFLTPASEDIDAARSISSKDDTFMNNFIHAIDKHEYLALFTSDAPAPQIQQTLPSTHPMLQRFETSVKQVQDDTTSEVTDNESGLMPDSIIQALLVMLPFLIILLIGVYCTFSLQSVLKYDLEKSKRQ